MGVKGFITAESAETAEFFRRFLFLFREDDIEQVLKAPQYGEKILSTYRD